MNDHHRITDAAIERMLDRRAPDGADAALLRAVLETVARTRQQRTWWASPAPSLEIPRLAFALVAIGLVIGMAILSITAGGIGPSRGNLGLTGIPAPTASDGAVSTVTVPPSISPSPGRCSTDTVKVMTGASMPPIDSDAASLPQLGSGRGVYLTRHTAGSTGGDLWVVGTARHTSTRIASVDGPRIDVLDVLDLSADGAWAILRVGTFSPSGTNPECADLYLVPTDGSPVTRLTRARAGDFVVGAGFSPGGSRVAYATWDAVFVIDLPSGQTVKLPGCETGYGVQPVRVLWAPDVDRFAILCQHVEIYDPSGRSAPTVVPSVDAQLNAVWADERHLLVALATSGPSQGGLHVDSFDIVARTSTLVGRIKDDGIEWVIPSLGGFSPDGRQLVAEGGEVGVPPGSDFKEVGYLAPTEDGAARVILGERQLQDVAWSADGGSIVYVDITDGSQPTLARLDVRTLERTTLGLLPPTYGGGVWQVP